MFSHIQLLVIATVLDIFSDAARFQHLTWWEQYDWYKEAAGSSEYEPSGLIKSRNQGNVLVLEQHWATQTNLICSPLPAAHRIYSIYNN